jgi:hypothetical protein
MDPPAATTLRINRASWAVPLEHVPAVAYTLGQVLPPEAYDPGFHGQYLRTTYIDTPSLRLRKARLKGAKYLTLRVRCYENDQGESYALSAKTEDQKIRVAITSQVATTLRQRPMIAALANHLPGDFLARLLELTDKQALTVASVVSGRRYAVEDDTDRLTFDVSVCADTGRCLPYSVLEFKSNLAGSEPPPSLAFLNLRPLKLSKFLWSTQP